MREHLVSIVLPAYNGEQYLSRSIESCLSQSYANLELILVDDASTDRTSEIIDSFSDPRIKKLSNATNQGLPRSLNIGFRAASGYFLTWTSVDNYYSPNAIELLVRELEADPVTGLIYGSFYLVDETDRVTGKKHCPPPVYLPRENTVGAYFMYRREVMETVGDYDPDLRLAEDYDYWLRIYRRFRVKHVDADGYYYRVHGASLTGTSRGAEVLRAATKAQSKNLTTLHKIRCTLYCAANPIASAVSKSAFGPVARTHLGRVWRRIGGRR